VVHFWDAMPILFTRIQGESNKISNISISFPAFMTTADQDLKLVKVRLIFLRKKKLTHHSSKVIGPSRPILE
jgi:hypothetical protein